MSEFSDLPNEVIEKIMQFLPLEERPKWRLLSHKWKEEIDRMLLLNTYDQRTPYIALGWLKHDSVSFSNWYRMHHYDSAQHYTMNECEKIKKERLKIV